MSGRIGWRRAGALVMAVLLMRGLDGASARASESCPAAVLTYYFQFHGGDTFLPVATFDTTIVNADGDTTRVGFDHIAGLLTMSAVGREWAGERVLERFDVTGVAAGTAVKATLDFDVDAVVFNNCGGGGCGANFIAMLVTPTDSVLVDGSIPGPCDNCTKVTRTTLSLPLTIVSGTPVEAAVAILYHTTNVGWGYAVVTGQYRIDGLPPDVRATTCVGSDVTPARISTWGRVKSLYR